MSKLYKAIKLKIQREGHSPELDYKIEIFWLTGALTDAEYNDLMGIVDEVEAVEG